MKRRKKAVTLGLWRPPTEQNTQPLWVFTNPKVTAFAAGVRGIIAATRKTRYVGLESHGSENAAGSKILRALEQSAK